MPKPRKRGLMAQVLSRMAATESLISDRHAESMLVGLLSEADKVEDPTAAWQEVRTELAETWGFDDGPDGPSKPFIYRDGVAVIPVHGILVNRFNYCWGFVTGYDFIRRQMNAALADDDVNLIVYDHDSPGGEAAGCDELAREIFASRSIKPSLALVNTLSASGGYWLASPCSRVVCAPSGSVGSIGVYILHMNIAKMLAEWGIEVEFVKNGKFKTSGNQYESLSESDRAYLQQMVDERAKEFHAAVAEFRGIEESVVKGTEARVMRPSEALSLGLIDAAESPTTAVASFVAELSNDDPPMDSEEEPMADAPEITSEQRAEIAAAERARVKGITTSEEAKGRESLAEHLAHNTDMTVEAAVAILAASPKAEEPKPAEGDDGDDGEGSGDGEGGEGSDDGDGEGEGSGEAAKGKTQFESAMDNGSHPNVGADGDGGNGGDQSESSAKVARILGAHSLATGRKQPEAAKAR